MKKISYLVVLVIAFIATSCLGSSDSKVELTRTLTSTHNFSVVQRNSDHSQAMFNYGADYSLEISVDQQTLSFAVSSLQYWGDQPRTSFRITDVPYKYDNNGAVVVELPTVEADGVTISDIKLSYLERTDGEISLPAWDITYTINDEYQVRAVQDIVALFGKADVTVIDTGSQYSTETPYYQLFFDPMKMHDNDMVDGYMILYSAQFAENMPAMNLKFYFSAKFTIGGFSINAESLKIYTIEGQTETEQPEFEISQFSAGGLFSLTSQNVYPYYFDFTVGGRYMVGLDLGYSIPQSWMLPDQIQ
ncbi:MAG: hypothetical protein K2H59_04115 [Muribaculaceae bacterium]|nr:hypothetical protein [Muribaculaceae bacterium]